MIKVFQAQVESGDGDSRWALAMGVTAQAIKHMVEELKTVTYVHVATVNTDDLDYAYERTNTIDNYWWDNEGVTKHFTAEGCRSTSCGDILMDGDKVYFVASFGFVELDKAYIDVTLKDAA